MKRKWLCLSAIVLLFIAGWSWLRFASPKKLAAETYDAAVAADDGGHAEKAKTLFAEACSEGSDDACRALGRKR